MDVVEHDLRSSNEVSSGVDQRKTQNSRDFVDEPVVQNVTVVETKGAACHSIENNDLEVIDGELGSAKAVAEGHSRVRGGSGEVSDRIEEGNNENSIDSSEISGRIEQGINENSSDSAVQVVVETRVVINPSESPFVSEDNRGLNAKVDDSGFSKKSKEDSKRKMLEAEKHSCVIDINCASAKSCGEKWDGESVCRICHLTSDQSPDRRSTTITTTDLIHLGCRCKDDLGIAHYQCAEAWFKLKGNRMCEICGESAKNVTGVGDIGFMEDWNERRLHTRSGSSASDRTGGCWRGQPFCNFLMACLYSQLLSAIARAGFPNLYSTWNHAATRENSYIDIQFIEREKMAVAVSNAKDRCSILVVFDISSLLMIIMNSSCFTWARDEAMALTGTSRMDPNISMVP
ncbi:Zinc finger, RING-CH-type [Parasponia andersonii]|uniref:Zinc finger, RING-CH-type n=1 Tax=Parasponia andersonii TaxID=3476 RepID=A0A2P5A6L9_PARAD|nr:Zinc finger, RING-CH-type [Parasponia andersonii]